MKEEIKSVIVDGLKEQVKSYIDLIPIAGVFINQALDVRGKIKQDRLMNFLDVFVQYCQDIREEDINIAELKKEEFGDFFEDILIKVSKTNSKEKLIAYSKLLKNQITTPLEIDEMSIMLDVINDLRVDHIKILKFYGSDISEAYNKHKAHAYFSQQGILRLSDEVADLEKGLVNKIKVHKIKEEMTKLDDEVVKSFKIIENIEKDEMISDYKHFYYIKHTLVSMGILRDAKDTYETGDGWAYQLTGFGEKILRFIEIN